MTHFSEKYSFSSTALKILFLFTIITFLILGCSTSDDEPEVLRDRVLVKEATYGKEGELLGFYYLYEYDENGNNIKRSTFNENDKLTYYKTMEYDENGNMTKESFYNAIYGLGLTNYISYEYDIYGNNTKETIYNAPNEVFHYYLREYDENGNMTSQSIHDASDQISSKDIWIYSDDGKLIEYHYFDSTIESYYTIEYGEHGQEIKRTFYYNSKEVGYYLYKYDDHWNMIEKTEHHTNSETIVYEYWEYDSNGNITKYTLDQDISDNNEGYIAYNYDDDGNMIKESGYYNDELTGYTIYEYQ